jgi:tape measure domain-containing protein
MAQAASIWVKLGLIDKNFAYGLKKAEKEVKKFGDRMNTLGTRITKGISLPFAVAGAASVKMAADMEQAKVALTTLTGSVSIATKQMQQLKQFSATTPFEFPELLSATRRMMAFGFQAKETIPTLKLLGNASFALGQGAEGVNNMILALGQMQMKGRVQSEEMTRQLGQYINAWKYLANYLKVDVPTAMKMTEKRMIDGATGVKAILLGLANDKRFENGMQKMSRTLLGLWSNFKDQLSYALADLGDLLIKTFDLKKVIQDAINSLKSFTDWFAKLDPGLRKIIANTALWAAALGPILIVIGKISLGWSALIPIFGQTIGLIKGIGTAFTAMAAGQAAATTATAGLAAAFAPFLVGAAIIAGLIGIVVLIKKLANSSKDAIKNYEKLAAAKESKKNVDNLAQAYGKLTDKINNAKPNSKEWKDLKEQQKDLMNQIAKNYPSVVTAYDKIGNARKIDLDLLQQLIDKEDELENKRLKKSQKQAKKAAQDALTLAKTNLSYYQKQLATSQKESTPEALQAKSAQMTNNKKSQQMYIKNMQEGYRAEQSQLAEQVRNAQKIQEKAQAQYDKVMGKKPKKTKNEYPFVCPICGDKFKTKAELEKHLKEIHENGVGVLSAEDLEGKQTPYQKAKEKWKTAKDINIWSPEEALRQWNKMVSGTAAGKEIEDFKQKQGELTKVKIEAELKAQNELALVRLDGYDKQLKELDQQEKAELSEIGIGQQRKKNIQDKYTLDRNRIIAERDKQALIDKANTNALQTELEAQTLQDQGRYVEAAIKQEEAKWERIKATLAEGTDTYKLEYKKFLDAVAIIQKDADEKLRAAQIESQKSKIDDQIQGLEYQKEEAGLLDDEVQSKKIIANLEKNINDLKIKRINVDISELQRQKDAEKDTTKQLEIQNEINALLRERAGFRFDNIIISSKPIKIDTSLHDSVKSSLSDAFREVYESKNIISGFESLGNALGEALRQKIFDRLADLTLNSMLGKSFEGWYGKTSKGVESFGAEQLAATSITTAGTTVAAALTTAGTAVAAAIRAAVGLLPVTGVGTIGIPSKITGADGKIAGTGINLLPSQPGTNAKTNKTTDFLKNNKFGKALGTAGNWAAGSAMGGMGTGAMLGSALGMMWGPTGSMLGGMLGGLFDSGGKKDSLSVTSDNAKMNIDFAEANFKTITLPASYQQIGKTSNTNSVAPIINVNVNVSGGINGDRELERRTKKIATAVASGVQKVAEKWSPYTVNGVNSSLMKGG